MAAVYSGDVQMAACSALIVSGNEVGDIHWIYDWLHEVCLSVGNKN